MAYEVEELFALVAVTDIASPEWADRVLQHRPDVLGRVFVLDPVPVVADSTWWPPWGLVVLVIVAAVLFFKGGGTVDKIKEKLGAMFANWPMALIGAILGAQQYMKDYGASPPTTRAQWNTFAWGLVYVVIFPALKASWTGSRAGTAPTPPGLEAVLTPRTGPDLTAYLPRDEVKVIPLALATPLTAPTTPPARAAAVPEIPKPPVIPPPPPYPYELKDNQWVPKA